VADAEDRFRQRALAASDDHAVALLARQPLEDLKLRDAIGSQPFPDLIAERVQLKAQVDSPRAIVHRAQYTPIRDRGARRGMLV